jgi:hypothetical protein
MNFQIDFGNFIQPVAAPNAPLYASVDGVAHALGGDECVFQDRATGAVHVMTLQVLQALDLCREFRPLDEHCATVAQRLGGLAGQADAVRRVVEGLIQRGLVISDTDYIARLTAPGGEANRSPLRAVVIRASGRPRLLGRLVDALIAYERLHRVGRRYVVIDCGPPDGHGANAAIVERLADAVGGGVEHVDRAARLAFVERAAAALPHADESLRAMFGADTLTPGAAHNLAALIGAGGRYVLLDESDMLPLTRAADAKHGLELVDGGPIDTTFLGSTDAALAMGVAAPGDPFEAHLALAGQPLALVLAQPEHAPTRASLRGVAPSRASRLDADSRVVATVVGRRGQAANRRVASLFLLDGDARAQFWRERNQYQRHLDGACLWRGVARARLVEPERVRPFMIDATRLVAPLPASASAADPLFGVMARALDRHGVAVQTPDTLGRDDGGAHDPDLLRRAERPAFTDYVADFVGARLADVRAAEPAARAGTVTAWLDDVAAAPESVRTELLDDFVRFRRADIVARLQAAYANAATQGAPAYWLDDVRELISANGKALVEAAPSRLLGWNDTLDAAQCAERLASELRDYAAALSAWPDVQAFAHASAERPLEAP